MMEDSKFVSRDDDQMNLSLSLSLSLSLDSYTFPIFKIVYDGAYTVYVRERERERERFSFFFFFLNDGRFKVCES
jgi:hypothetical protein